MASKKTKVQKSRKNKTKTRKVSNMKLPEVQSEIKRMQDDGQNQSQYFKELQGRETTLSS